MQQTFSVVPWYFFTLPQELVVDTALQGGVSWVSEQLLVMRLHRMITADHVTGTGWLVCVTKKTTSYS